MRSAVTRVQRRREWSGEAPGHRMSPVARRALISFVAALALAAPAGAGTIIVKLGLTPGKLAVASAPTTVQAGATASIPVKVADGRGNGNGWTLRFATGTGLSVTGITARCASNSTCTLPTAAGGPSGSTVLQAARDSGMGIVDLVVTVKASSTTKVGFAVS